MVQELQIGRVGLDVDLIDPEQVRVIAAASRRVSLRGVLISDTLAETQALRDELAAQVNPSKVIPVTWTGDALLDGFYRLRSASIDLRSLNDRGFFPFQAEVERLGTDADLVFRSRITGTVLTNDMTVTEAESAPFHAPPRGHVAYDPGATVPSSISRTGESGAVLVYVDVDFAVDPYFSVAAGAWYAGAVKVSSGSPLRLRSGDTIENPTPNDWRLENELVRVSPNGTGGRLDVEHHDGTQWETAKVWRIQVAGGDVGEWTYAAILRNDPEECAVRLTRTVSAGGVITLDLALRRGSRFVSGFLTHNAAATLKVVQATAEASSTNTPSGASAPVAVVKSSNDADGNRAVVGSSSTFVADLTNCGLSIASTTELDFFIGSRIDGSGSQAGDGTSDLCLQYLGHVSEETISTRR